MSTAIESLFQPLTIEQAPEASKPILEQIQKGYGFIPNLMATFANNPVVLRGYLALDVSLRKVRLLRSSVRSSSSRPASLACDFIVHPIRWDRCPLAAADPHAFEQCQHRMACAKCDFYMPKQSTAALLLEGKEHLLLLQEIPLG